MEDHPSRACLASVAWTAILATLGGCGLYWACLQRSSSARVTSVLFLSPPVTMVWAWAMFREPLSWLMVVGTVISGAGILLVINQGSGELGQRALACKRSRPPG
ncbi:DMT family transporter [Burkholderia sp. WSM2232]|uniref:DMT family transporter n=1 Tax=Burkholderia sp. WSM2232 TaxID=944436 RepID=UPI001E39AAD6|nr:DMT family transporter [Burkholderia sp. WSM2232]